MPIVLRPPGLDRVPLSKQLDSLGRVRRRIAIIAQLLFLAATVIGATALTASLDVAWHLPPLARGFALALTLVLAGITSIRLRAAMQLPIAPLAVAMELEERFPQLNDSLASAISFQNLPDRNVSKRLRTVVIRRAERLSSMHNFGGLVPMGQCWRGFWLFLAIFCMAAALAILGGTRTLPALARFVDPFGSHPWPSRTRLEIVSPANFPARMPKGDSFELKFVVGGEIPDRAVVEFQGTGGEEFLENYPLVIADPRAIAEMKLKTGEPVAIVASHLDPGRLSRSFHFRIRANDAETPWLEVMVVPPPHLVPLDEHPSPRIHFSPPDYTGLRAANLPDGAAVIEVPMGSHIALSARADVPLAHAFLTYLGDRTAIERAALLAHLGQLDARCAIAARILVEQMGTDIPIALSGEGGSRMDVDFTPSLSGMYALKMIDESGLVGTRLLEIRLAVDPPPSVSLLRPSPGRDAMMVVPEASLPIQLFTEDKIYALRRLQIEYRFGFDGPIHTLSLADASMAERAGPAIAGGLIAAVRPRPVRFETSFPMPVSSFRRDDGSSPRDGDLLIIRGAADDWDDVSVLKEKGHSSEVEIRIASREAVDAFLLKELAALRPDLLRVRDQEREARNRVAEVRPLPDGTLGAEDREKLLAAEVVQRQVRGKLADARDGIRARVEMLRELARINSLPRTSTTDRLESMAEELGRMADRDLAAIEPKLGEARQLAMPPIKPGQEKELGELLQRVERHQKAVEDGLTSMLDLLAEWGGAGEIRGEARLLRDAVLRDAAAAEKTFDKLPAGKAPSSLNQEQRSELDRAGGKIDQLAEQAGQLIARATRLTEEKDKQAKEASSEAGEKQKLAAALAEKLAALPKDSPDRQALIGQVEAATEASSNQQAVAKKASEEAAALRKAIEAASGQELPDEIRRAAEATRGNRRGEAAEFDRSAADRLAKLADSLAERGGDDVPELAKKQQRAANELDALAGKQDELRKRAEAAGKNASPDEREAELKKLAPEQQKLVEQTRELLQKLTRERAEEAAKDARTALDKMESARDALERGSTSNVDQAAATAKLDEARDKLDSKTTEPERQLADEKRRKLVDQIEALLERQKAATVEAARIQEQVLRDKKWPRPLLESYADLEDRERSLAVEIQALADREFENLPVFARIVADAAKAAEKAADKAKSRREEALDAAPDLAFDADLERSNDERVRRPMTLATRRLEHILSALKPDDRKNGEERKKAEAGTPPSSPQAEAKKAEAKGEAIPLLAQVKALRSLQAELNQRTNDFAKANPEGAKLTDDDREEIKDIEEAQLQITLLFEKLAKAFAEQKMPEEKP